MSDEEEPEDVKRIRAMAAVMRAALEREFPATQCDQAIVASLTAASDYLRTCAHYAGEPIDLLETSIRLRTIIDAIIEAARRRKSQSPS